jgi:hypothetical protein
MTVAWNEQLIDDFHPPRPVVAHLSLRDGVLTAPPESDYVDTVHTPAEQVFEGSNDPPALSGDGRHVAFVSHLCGIFSCETALAGTPLLSLDGARATFFQTVVEVEDLTSRTTVRLDLDETGALLQGQASHPAMSADGRILVFTEYDDGSGEEGTELTEPINAAFAVDRDTDGDGKFGPGGGEPMRSTIVSRDVSGAIAYGTAPTVSADGRYVAFETTSPHMHDGVDPPPGRFTEGPVTELVVRDRIVDAQQAAAGLPRLPGELASVGRRRDCVENLPATETCAGDNSSHDPSLSADGSVVAFTSQATDLVDRERSCCTSRAYAREFRPFAHADPADFGTVPVESSTTRTITVRHNGFGPLHITGVSVSGREFTVFPAQTCVTATLYETGSCMISVRFSPTASGTRTAQLRIDTTAGPVPATVPLTGGGGGVASGFVAAPNPLVFPVVRPALSPSNPLAVTIGNGGPVAWRIGAVTVIGGPNLFPGDFRITASSCTGVTLAPGRTCLVTVVGTAHGSGLRQAILSVADTSAGGPHLVGLALTGAVPTVQVNPGALPSGRVAAVTGQGFPVSHMVALSRRDTVPVTVRTSGTGTFSAPLVVFDHALVGTAPVVVTSPGTMLRAEAPLLIVLGTFQPPDFTGRR